MVARRLRWVLALQIGALWLTFHMCGISALAALLASVAALLVLYALLTLLTFAVAGLGLFARTSWKLGFAAALWTFIVEWLSFFALFAVIQPFEALFNQENYQRTTRRQEMSARPRILMQQGALVVGNSSLATGGAAGGDGKSGAALRRY